MGIVLRDRGLLGCTYCVFLGLPLCPKWGLLVVQVAPKPYILNCVWLLHSLLGHLELGSELITITSGGGWEVHFELEARTF